MATVRYDPFNRENLVHWFLLVLTSKDILEKTIVPSQDEEGHFVDVQISVDGVNVSDYFVEAIRRLEKHFENETNRKAEELVKEKLGDLFDGIGEIQEKAERKLCDLLKISLESE